MTISTAKIKELNKLIQNTSGVISKRAELSARAGQQFGMDRNIYKTLGYKRDPGFDDYWSYYKRHDISNAIITKPVSTTWRNRPIISEVGKNEGESDFVKLWEKLVKRLRVYHYLERVDRLTGVGKYGVLFIGAAGNDTPDKPIEKLSGPESILYLSAYSEGTATIKTTDDKANSPRFGLPEIYELRTVTSGKTITIPVHWSRVLHIAENIDEGQIYGTPRLEAVFNRIFDLEKVVGGAAETFWKVADRGLMAKVDKDFTLKDGAAEEIEDQIEEYIHDLRRFLFMEGVEVKSLEGEEVDPKNAFDVIMSVISGQTGIPKRILLGSERGELSSTTDQESWFGLIGERQVHYAEPVLLRAFIDWTFDHGIFKLVEYETEWPSLYEVDPKEKAETAKAAAEAMKSFAEAVALGAPIGQDEFREHFFDFPAEFEGLTDADIARLVKMEDDEQALEINKLIANKWKRKK